MIEEAKEANEWRGLPSRRLQPKRKCYNISPDSAPGLAAYFARAHAEVCELRWGDQGFAALRKVFYELKKEGLEPERLRAMVRIFFLSWNPETSTRPAWQVFISRRRALVVRTREFKSEEKKQEEHKDFDAVMTKAERQLAAMKGQK